MVRSHATSWFKEEEFWRGVASSVVSSLITAYVLLILGASLVFAATGADGSDVQWTAGLNSLGLGMFTPVVLGVIVWFAREALRLFRSSREGSWGFLSWPFLVFVLGCLGLMVYAVIYYVALFAVIRIRALN